MPLNEKQTPYPATTEFYGLALHSLGSEPGLTVSDHTGEARFGSPEEYKKFIDSGQSVAEYLDEQQRLVLSRQLDRRLPSWDSGNVAAGVGSALAAALERLQAYSRERVQQTDTTDEERYEMMRGERDLNHALLGITSALDLYTPDYMQSLAASDDYGYFSDTHAWYLDGKRSRNGGFIATYELCNESYYPDDEDHARELEEISREAIDNDTEEYWPDEFHHPAKLEIRVDPERRIEFVYTPTVESAQSRHASRSEVVTHDGKTRVYENSSLSIRIDLDPTAPSGIALDIGRSEYDGERDGRRMHRNADLLGRLLSKTSSTGSHEYTGFTPEMADGFKEFAERLSIQLNLQHKEYLADKKRRDLANAGLKLAERSAA